MSKRQSITMDQIAFLEVDEDGRLYWHGEQVILERRLRLENYQIVLAVIATVGALLAGVHPFLVSFGILGQ